MSKLKLKILLVLGFLLLSGWLFVITRPVYAINFTCTSCGYQCGGALGTDGCSLAPEVCWNKYCKTCQTGYTCFSSSKSCTGGICTQTACVNPAPCGDFYSDIGCYAPYCRSNLSCSCGCSVTCGGGVCQVCPSAAPSPSPSTIPDACASCPTPCGYGVTSGLCCENNSRCMISHCYLSDNENTYCFVSNHYCGEGSDATGKCACNEIEVTCEHYQDKILCEKASANYIRCVVRTACTACGVDPSSCTPTSLSWTGQMCSGTAAGQYLCVDNCGGYDCKTFQCGSGSPAPTASPEVCNYIISAPVLTPPDAGVAITGGDGNVSTSWSQPADVTYFEYELYPAGSDCSDLQAYCPGVIGDTSYIFLPLSASYQHRVRGCSSACGGICSDWAEATFTVASGISGQVKSDINNEALMVGEKCVLAGAGAIQPGSDSQVVVGADIGYVDGSGNYSVTTLAGSGLVATLVSGDPTYVCTCPLGCSYSTSSPQTDLDYFVSSQAFAWWQVVDGDVHADGGNISSQIPAAAANPYLITGVGGGVASFTGSIDIGSGMLAENGQDWQAQTSYQGNKTDYGYFERILKDDPLAFSLWTGSQPGENGVYSATGDISTSGVWNITTEKIVILADGNVTIADNINVAPGGFLAIISSGNIIIGDTVTNIEGVYVADGAISSGTSDSQLIGEGIFTGWLGIDLTGRNFNTIQNNTTPSEIFVYRPDLVRSAYQYLLKSKIAWQEVAP